MTDRLVYFNRRLHAFLSDSSLGMVSSILTEKGSKSHDIDLDLLGSKRSLIWYLSWNVRSLCQIFAFSLLKFCSICLIRQKVLQMWQLSVFSNSERLGSTHVKGKEFFRSLTSRIRPAVTQRSKFLRVEIHELLITELPKTVPKQWRT